MASTPKSHRGKHESRWVIIKEKDLAASYRGRIRTTKVVRGFEHAMKGVSKRNSKVPTFTRW